MVDEGEAAEGGAGEREEDQGRDGEEEKLIRSCADSRFIKEKFFPEPTLRINIRICDQGEFFTYYTYYYYCYLFHFLLTFRFFGT